MKLRQGNPEEVGMSAQRMRHVVDLTAGWVADGVTPTLVFLVARKGVIVLHKAFGRLGPEPDAPPLELDTLFPMTSLTKPITATAAMLLVEEGLLGLNRPVQWYIPEFNGDGKDAVMVHHLLTHTSGLEDEDVDAHLEGKGESIEAPPLDETQYPLIHRRLFLGYGTPLHKPPGVEMSYCNYGYELVGEIVRRVSGQSLGRFCRERIFQPLGIADTDYGEPVQIRHRLVRRSRDGPAGFLGSPEHIRTYYASGAVHSTAMDMAVFGQMFLNGGAYGDVRILSPASVREMTRNQIPGIGARYGGQLFPEASWGFGWSTRVDKQGIGYAETLQSHRAFSHGGAGGIFLWVDPVYELLGVYLSVASRGGVPAHMLSWEGSEHSAPMGRVDMLINAVTAAVVD